jgi:hypothetical protein
MIRKKVQVPSSDDHTAALVSTTVKTGRPPSSCLASGAGEAAL